MADAPASPFAVSGPWGSLRTVAPAGRWSLRGNTADLAPVAAAWGAALPERLLTLAADGARTALRLGPDEWFLVGNADGAALARAASGIAGSLVDVGDRSIGLELAGPAATMILNAGNPLDLSDAAFPAGSATRTVFGKAEILLWRPTVQPVWRIEVWRSFADYLTRYLTQAVAGL